jgi:hypothetical protein
LAKHRYNALHCGILYELHKVSLGLGQLLGPSHPALAPLAISHNAASIRVALVGAYADPSGAYPLVDGVVLTQCV